MWLIYCTEISSFFSTIPEHSDASVPSCCMKDRAAQHVTSVMWLRKWLSMLGFECKSLISTVMEFLNLCQDGRDASIRLWSNMNNEDTAVEQMDYI